ncbi:MAG: hypothetical protein DI604_32035 [Delftia acidovorans]|nr:MAG: hypothetical protein DI604_32035 [Delftia acidovorans]
MFNNRFNPDWFNEHLEGIGQEILWSAATACPCINPQTRAPDPKCPFCSGRGYEWAPGELTVAGVAGEKYQRKWIEMGLYEDGDIVVTIPESSVIWDKGGEYDRLTMLNATHRFSRVMVKGHPSERLWGPVESIHRVFWRNSNGETVEGAIPTVNADGTIVFPDDGVSPLNMTRYTIVGNRYSDYFLFRDLTANRNEHSGMRLPKRVVLRRFELMVRSGVISS